MDDPQWLVDEMLGRLSRYLRFLGYDTEYVHGVADEEIARRSRAEHRRVITRDRALAAGLPSSILLTRTDIAGQMQELARAYPSLRRQVRLDRCTLCNGELVRLEEGRSPPAGPPGTPAGVLVGKVPLFRCSRCAHLFWEGSHTKSMRVRLAQWIPARRVS